MGKFVPDENFMRQAITKARKGMCKGQTPFGACVVKDGQVLCCEHNVVWNTTDITAHAEVHAIRKACRKLGSIDLSGCVIYSTCEPCPMCFSACHWARISTVVFGAGIADARRAGFNELEISNRVMKSRGKSEMALVSGFLRAENIKLFTDWQNTQGRKLY